MSEQTYIPVQDDVRYDVIMSTIRDRDYIIYQITVIDLAIGVRYELAFRFSEVKKLHESLVKNHREVREVLPLLPRTHSIGIFNRTNKDHRKIEERRRELEFYFDKLLNNPVLRRLSAIKTLLAKADKLNWRTQSSLPAECSYKCERTKSLPQIMSNLEYSM